MEQQAARRGKCTDGRHHSTAVHCGHVKVPGVLHVELKSIDQLSVFSERRHVEIVVIFPSDLATMKHPLPA